MPVADPAEQFEGLVRSVGDLTPQERLIGAFVSIRDIPYGSANSPTPFAVLTRNRGTGKGKHMLLKLVCENLGYEVREFWARHDFGDMPIDPWPEALAEFRGERITGFHDFLKVKVDGRFVTVDATFDKPLAALGFPVREWDGVTDMALTVAAVETFPVEPPIDDHKRKLVSSLPQEMQDRRRKFLKTLKRWLEEERTKMG